MLSNYKLIIRSTQLEPRYAIFLVINTNVLTTINVYTQPLPTLLSQISQYYYYCIQLFPSQNKDHPRRAKKASSIQYGIRKKKFLPKYFSKHSCMVTARMKEADGKQNKSENQAITNNVINFNLVIVFFYSSQL